MSEKIAGPEIERLISLLGRMPGLGRRSARKAALALLDVALTAFLTPLAAPGAGQVFLEPAGGSGALHWMGGGGPSRAGRPTCSIQGTETC